MAENAPGESSFGKVFIPGLVIGLIVGMAIGALVGPLLDRNPEITQSRSVVGPPSTAPRDERRDPVPAPTPAPAPAPANGTTPPAQPDQPAGTTPAGSAQPVPK